MGIHNALGNPLLIALTDTSVLGIDFTSPHIGLFTVEPTSGADEGTEVVGNNYARKVVTTQFGTSTALSISNDDTPPSGGDLVFTQATPAGWGLIKGWGLYNALSGAGTLYFSSKGTTFTDTQINAQDTARFAHASLTWTVQ